MNTIRAYAIRESFPKRHPIATTLLAGPLVGFSLLMTAAIGVGGYRAMHDHQGSKTAIVQPTVSSDPSIANFNDGFATAKQDDCEQGDAQACDWIAQQGR